MTAQTSLTVESLKSKKPQKYNYRFHAKDTIMLMELLTHPDLQKLAAKHKKVNPIELADFDAIAQWFREVPSLKCEYSTQLYTAKNCKKRAIEILNAFAKREKLDSIPNDFSQFNAILINAIARLKSEYVVELDTIENHLNKLIHECEKQVSDIMKGKYDPPYLIEIQKKIDAMQTKSAQKENKSAQQQQQQQQKCPPMHVPLPTMANKTGSILSEYVTMLKKSNNGAIPAFNDASALDEDNDYEMATPPTVNNNNNNSSDAKSIMDSVVDDFFSLYVSLAEFKEQSSQQSKLILEQRWSQVQSTLQSEYEKRLKEAPLEAHIELRMEYETSLKMMQQQKNAQLSQMLEEIQRKITKSHEITKEACKKKYSQSVDVPQAMRLARTKFTSWHETRKRQMQMAAMQQQQQQSQNSSITPNQMGNSIPYSGTPTSMNTTMSNTSSVDNNSDMHMVTPQSRTSSSLLLGQTPFQTTL